MIEQAAQVVLWKRKGVLMMQTGDNGGKLDSRQCLETNQEAGSGMSVIRQQGPGHWPDGKSQDLGC